MFINKLFLLTGLFFKYQDTLLAFQLGHYFPYAGQVLRSVIGNSLLFVLALKIPQNQWSAEEELFRL